MNELPSFTGVKDIHMGHNARQEAWMHHFLIENNLDYQLSPALVASPQQLRFMVALADDQVYVPCSDELFKQFYQDDLSPDLQAQYADAWQFIETAVQGAKVSHAERQRILQLCRYRFELYVASRMILPSRLVKRLVGIVLSATGEPDPFRKKKQQSNAKMAAILADPRYQTALRACPDITNLKSISDLRWAADYAELQRLFRVATHRDLWQGRVSPEALANDLHTPCADYESLHTLLGPEKMPRKKILYLPDVAGGFMADLLIVKSLLRQGHQVVLALKGGFYFNTPVLWDLETDPALKAETEGLFVLHDDSVSKNALLQHLREQRLVIIGDGTAELLNLYRASVTFARAWKECDLVIAKGRRNSQVLLGTSHEFTRDILCFWRDENGPFHMRCKQKPAWVHKFTEKDLTARADAIIANMRRALGEGKSVMFYSAIIGSVPGQTKTAIELVTVFVRHLRERMENTFIINPAEHFEEGLDGDDLMFMWERVQRSGYLDVWRFQTVDDIETSFSLLGRKVPSIWLGKDATFSTGCTKEMHIAVDVQRLHPEMQIIGPSAEKFFRRHSYGVGKYFDVRITST